LIDKDHTIGLHTVLRPLLLIKVAIAIPTLLISLTDLFFESTGAQAGVPLPLSILIYFFENYRARGSFSCVESQRLQAKQRVEQ
jgi:hypothetical protein